MWSQKPKLIPKLGPRLQINVQLFIYQMRRLQIWQRKFLIEPMRMRLVAEMMLRLILIDKKCIFSIFQ